MQRSRLKDLVKNVDGQLFELVSHLICSICQDFLTKPMTTPCGHSFCNICIRRVLMRKNNSGCPLCKTPVQKNDLEENKVKLTLTEICNELPGAFTQDVIDLTSETEDLTDDILKTSKLAQLSSQEYIKPSKSKRKKSLENKSSKQMQEPEVNPPESLAPVLQKSKNVLEYPSIKRKKMDDLQSISQTEALSTSSVCEPHDINKELQNIKKMQPEEKVKEWFDAVGDNIYVNSPNSFLGEKETGSPKAKENETKCITKPTGDPYEFVPSQNNRLGKSNRRKSKRKSKKIFDFEALQNFTRESLKRNSLLKRAGKEEDERDTISGGDVEENISKTPAVVTASQKFDKLLSETKENEKGKTPKAHTLYSASQASSPKFLDCSYNSKIDFENDSKTRSRKKLIKAEDNSEALELFKGDFNIVDGRKTRQRSSYKRKRSLDVRKSNEKKKRLFLDNGDEKSTSLEETPESGVQEVKARSETKLTGTRFQTKLLCLLKELADEVTRPEYIEASEKAMITDENKNSKLIENSLMIDKETPQKTEYFSQVLNGFCTQIELQEEKQFKEMVNLMEKELTSEEMEIDNIEISMPTRRQVPDVNLSQRNLTTDKNLNDTVQKRPCEKLIPFNLLGKIMKTKNTFIEFLQLGRLTPNIKRSKSSVVKLIFPIGLTSFAKKRALLNRCAVGVQTLQPLDRNSSPKKLNIQTKRMSSVDVQTSPKKNRSVEIQTSQRYTFSKEAQTSQRYTSCKEAQTSQQVTTCIEVQTSQFFPSQLYHNKPDNNADIPLFPENEENIDSEENLFSLPSKDPNPKATPRKPSFKHRKIAKKTFQQESGLFPIPSTPHKETFSSPANNASNKEALIDSQMEKEFETSWKKSAKTDNAKPEEESDDSDVQLPKTGRNLREILSQSNLTPTTVIENYETRQKIPLEVRKISASQEVEVVDLGTPSLSETNSEELMKRVLKNIDMDLIKKKDKLERDERNPVKGEKSEESDSDFYVEQTPPRSSYQRIIEQDSGKLDKTRKSEIPEPKKKIVDNVNSEGTDLIEDSVPKNLIEMESFLLLSAPEKALPTPKKSTEMDIDHVNKHVKSTKPNENDQNEINATPKNKPEYAKRILESWKKSEDSQKKNSPFAKKKLCVVASSVKNLDLVQKFAAKFKIEYSGKPTKDMTHLIVGLHENDEGELLPLCTFKLLYAMANRKWVVSEAWMETCLKKNAIVPEEAFETADPVGGSGCKNARLSAEPLFKNLDVYLLGSFQTISKDELANLIVNCGGNLLSKPEQFSLTSSKVRIIVADRDCLTMSEVQLQEMYEKYSTVILSRDVIIMSIQSYKLANFSPYLLHLASEEEMLKMGYPNFLARSEEEEGGDEGVWNAAD